MTLRELYAVVDRSLGYRGNAEFRRLVRLADGSSESEAERKFQRLLRDAGITGWVALYRWRGMVRPHRTAGLRD